MTTQLIFWVIMLVWLLFGLYRDRAAGPLPIGGHVVLWILLALLGWRVFGAAIRN